jgi:hypothetical protein
MRNGKAWDYGEMYRELVERMMLTCCYRDSRLRIPAEYRNGDTEDVHHDRRRQVRTRHCKSPSMRFPHTFH